MLLGLLANDLLDHLGLWLAGSGVGDLGLVLDDLDDLLDLFVVLLIEAMPSRRLFTVLPREAPSWEGSSARR